MTAKIFLRNTLLLSSVMPLLLTTTLFAIQPLEKYKNTYKNSLSSIVLEHGNSVIELHYKYKLTLKELEQKSMKTGKLENLLAVKKEMERFETEKTIFAEAISEDYSDLTRTHKKWSTQLEELETNQAKKIVSLVEKYSKALESLQRKLTQDNKIKEAVAVKIERDRIEADPDIASATKFLEDLKEAKTEKKPTAIKQPERSSSVFLPMTIRKGLVLHYSFSTKGQTSVKDSSIKKHTGKLSGGTWIAKGIIGGSLKFDGKSTFIDVGNPAALQITGDQTIAMWICPATLNDRRNPYNKAYGGEGTMTLEPSGIINYYHGTSGKNDDPYTSVGMSNPLKVDEWSHIVLVRDLQKMKITWYKNGKKISEKDAPYPEAKASSYPLYIGKGYTSPFHGMLDEVMIFNRALSSQDIGTLLRFYNSKIKLMPPAYGNKPTSL